ncbi:FecR family protein [Sphingobacterium sp. JB170]|uniref:FecR family protein n=1 Tax=Sphingobacterium sp. JB170 TaxID=1434842 RepID=UPI00097F3E18|nr:FecR domain-containing protein [Sphingobacterium sp. JB170]SJN42890.1 putative anti-sigma factor [Sphingobacterium sp. JB170]
MDENKELEQGLQDIDPKVFASWVDKNIIVEENVEFTNQEGVFDRILKNIDRSESSVHTFIPWYKRTIYRVAAACIAVSFCALMYYGNHNGIFGIMRESGELANTTNEPMELPEEKALVTLADGTQMLLDGSTGDTLRYKGLEITRLTDGSVVMQRRSPEKSYFNEADRHKITAPKGVAVHVYLPDGTGVWLNSGSTITVLASYGENERRVELQGEGFFDVTPNKQKAFIVKAKNSIVRVLGTQFNLSAYSEDMSVKTTLIHGSVDVSAQNNKLRLTPGEQAVVSRNADIALNKDVNISEIVDWKDGYFRFNDQPIGVILQELARWYPIEEVQMELTAPDNFTGSLKRSKKLGDVLDAIASVSDLKFVVHGGRVIVMK